MLEFYQQVLKNLEKSSVVIATVIETKGSVPREVGAKMLISPNGKNYGTVGGGAGEARVIHQALKIFQDLRLTHKQEGLKRQTIEIDLSGATNRDIQGICGGRMRVLLQLWEGDWGYKLVNQIVNILISGKSISLNVPLNGQEKPYLIDYENLGNVNREKTDFIECFTEELTPSPILLIIGAGHVALALAKVAQIAGFEIIIQDDRAEYASKERFPGAIGIISQPIESIVEVLKEKSDLYIALVTRGYLQDLDALRIILNYQLNQPKYQPKYIGMIGSKKRIDTAFKIMQNEGYKLQELENIHAPIGLDIGALTPEEIAVSICAELIQVRRNMLSVRTKD